MGKRRIKDKAKGLSNHQLPSVLVSAVNNGYERVSPAKTTVCSCSCSCPCCSTLSSSDWASLPGDLLELILEKLLFVSDYIRFTSICKPWNSVAMNHKEKRMKLSNHEPPWLLVYPEENSKEWRLYNFVAKEFHNFKLRTVPPYLVENETCYGSCCGWLFFMKESSLTVFNPLSNTVINLPPFTKFAVEDYDPRWVKLSRDPSFGSFEVLATNFDNGSSAVAHLKYGDEFWTYSSTSTWKQELLAITFFKNGKLGVTVDCEIVSLDVISGECIKINQITPPWFGASHNGLSISQVFFVETTNDELLVVCRMYEDFDTLKTYKIFKLQIDSNGGLEYIQVRNLGDNSLFLGYNCGISVLASNYPKCIPNAIYCGFYSWDFDNMSVIDVLDIEDEYVERNRLPKGFRKAGNYPFSDDALATWVVPSMKF